MSQGVVPANLVLAWSPNRWTTTPSSSGRIPRVGRSLRTSSSDQVPRVTGSEASHDSRASRPTRSGAAVHESLRQHLEDKHLAPSWPPSERTPDLTLSLFPRYDDYGMDKGKTVSC